MAIIITDDCINCGQSASLCLFPWAAQGAPWDWWNNDPTDPLGYPLAATQNPLAPAGVSAETYACQSTIGNPDMSEAKGIAMAAMIQDFICPRIYAALGLEAGSGCPINLDELGVNKKLIKTIDITGREISPNTKRSITLQIFDNGKVEKNYIIK